LKKTFQLQRKCNAIISITGILAVTLAVQVRHYYCTSKRKNIAWWLYTIIITHTILRDGTQFPKKTPQILPLVFLPPFKANRPAPH
jgi:hypothetical protein